MDFIKKVQEIERHFPLKDYTMTSKMCLEVVEQMLRYVLQHQETRLGESTQLRIREAENFIGRGEAHLDQFSLWQLIGVFRKARFVDAWELASGRELSGIRLMNLDELPRLHKKFFHDQKSATRTEAELLLYCVHVLGETFELVRASKFPALSLLFSGGELQ
ncbi:hypothetical protein U27_06179 [Candidatus Vecturithrix granuli]|uniref:Uncharacterized protein n=1 Tax=Vecturithrix granuli TaxID=1499967 RepID=A0A081C3P7_VECG1|nr:hypothetical protein U27_06179 [Candidatus Vecturithrix granuli]